ncbi:MAG: beta-galactosidase [Oscillospiraceae bacterium]|nr:beta-galactosidase [Oscillospiraceae bacterium]
MKIMKHKNILIITLCVVIVAVIIAAVIFLVNNKSKNREMNTMSESITEMSQTDSAGSLDMNGKNETVSIVTPPDKPAYYDALTDMLRKNLGSDIDIKEISWTDLTSSLKSGNNDVVILPNADVIPFGSAPAVDRYLKNGGKLLTLGGPPLSTTLYPSGDNWLTRENLILQNPDRQILFDFGNGIGSKGWSRSTDTPKNGQSVETGDFDSPDGSDSLHVVLANVAGWDVISRHVIIPQGCNTIGLYAKGGPNTTFLSVELDEKDKSRWYAVFPVTDKWQYIVLTADDFKYWSDNTSVGRGGDGDKVSIGNVNNFVVGIAFSGIKPGANEYWIDSVCAVKTDNLAEQSLIIDGLSPDWKFYPITNGDKAVAFENQIFVSSRNYILPQSLFSPSPRPQGTGYKRGREARFVPLIEVYDSKNLRSGFLAWMFVNSNASGTGAYNSSIIAGFGTSDPAFYNNDGIAAVLDVVRTMLNDTMFIEAGATEYLYVDSETKSVPLGAYIRGKNADGLTMDIDLYKNGDQIKHDEYDLSQATWKISKNGEKLYNQGENYDLSSGKPDSITVTLKKDGQNIDRISHEIVFWSPKPESERKYITVSNNEFMRDGKPLRLYGVNFMPSSGIGVNAENGEYFEYYVSSESYDPDVFYKDLLRVKEIGFNAVSLFVYYDTAMQTKNMLHLIDMCDRLGLVVDLSLRPHSDPFNFDEQEVIDTIKSLHISELDNVSAYDIAWERTFGSYEPSYSNSVGRKAYDSLWERWVVDNYGSINDAEKTWGCSIPRNGSIITSPSDDMLRTDGDYSKMVAAYRRFVNDLISEKHNDVCDAIKAYDPNHLISSRVGSSGLPLLDPGSDMGYDYQALATAFDFMSPEGYLINGDFNTAEQGIFTNAYARYCKPDSPVVWKEFGYSIWTGSNFNGSEQIQEVQADYYKKIYDMAITGHTGGMFCWWFPGGYRTNENSDFGVINPDGSDRLVTGVIRAERDVFLNQPLLGEPDIFFEIDPEMSVTGIKAVYENIKDDFLSAVKSGKIVAFKDISDGTDTSTVPDTAVGGGTAGAENPSEYVNGDFREVYVKLSDGSWKRVNFGDTVSLPAGPIEIKAIMGNTLRAEWLSESTSKAAYVSLVSTAKSGITFDMPLAENVKYLGILTQEFKLCDSFENKTVIAFRFSIKNRFPFGTPFEFTVTPK